MKFKPPTSFRGILVGAWMSSFLTLLHDVYTAGSSLAFPSPHICTDIPERDTPPLDPFNPMVINCDKNDFGIGA